MTTVFNKIPTKQMTADGCIAPKLIPISMIKGKRGKLFTVKYIRVLKN